MEWPRTPIIWQSKKRWHIPIAHTTNSPLAKIAFRCKFTECVSQPEIAVGEYGNGDQRKGCFASTSVFAGGCTSESSGSSCSCCCFFEWVTFRAALPPFTTAERAAAERESGSALSLKREIFPSEPAAIAVRMTAHRQQAISSRANLEPDHQLRSRRIDEVKQFLEKFNFLFGTIEPRSPTIMVYTFNTYIGSFVYTHSLLHFC